MSAPVLPFQPGAASLVDDDPTGVFAPAIVGQLAVDPSTGVTYVANGVTESDWVAGAHGGSQPGAARWLGPFPFAFDTPNILTTGHTVYTIADGGHLFGGAASFGMAFNGTTPTIALGFLGDLGTIFSTPANLTDPNLAGNAFEAVQGQSANGDYYAKGGAVPVVVSLSDGSGGDPGSTQGAGNIFVLVATPSLT